MNERHKLWMIMALVSDHHVYLTPVMTAVISSPSPSTRHNITDITNTSNTMNTSGGQVSVPDGCVAKQESDVVPWDNEDNLISKQADVIVNTVFNGVFLPLLFLISFSTNLLNMLVFWKQGLRERINMCLFSLSFVDMLFVVGAYGYYSDTLYMFIIGKGDQLGASAAFFTRHYLIGLSGLVSASQVVSSVVALERCLCISRPLLVKSLMSTRKTALVLWPLLILIVMGIFVCAGMRYTVICVFDVGYGTSVYQLYPSEFYFQNQEVIHFFDGVVYGSLLPGICAVCVTICTAITYVKMKKLSQWREGASSASDSLTARDVAIARMIVATSVLFIVCMVPSIVVRASVILVPELKVGGRYDNLSSVFIRVYVLTSVINSTFNFFVYYAYGTKFRLTVKLMFFSWCRCYCCIKTKASNGKNVSLK